MTRRLLLSGTDTGVGKTFVGVALARALVARGARVVAVKPFESGCGPTAGAAEDGVRLARATGQGAPTAALVRLPAPVAPAMAADLVGITLDFPATVAATEALGQGADVLLVEGAGGLLAPLTWRHTALDLARALGAEIVLVAADRLGTIGQVRAALRVLEGARLSLAALVLGAPAEPDASTGTNAAALARCGERAPDVVLPRFGDPEGAVAALGPLAARLRA